ncbi:DUF1659 domain-containing protein [Clostridium aestuarii]|uniref:DUF1659 domain-containing protein n=1 Tax=Clostridium aestuarii TaxID=338193 RepID=A0ABT4D5A7_9CLOT|nr:DUF1659 domain-containing protein [Clostridium aestuarii]MCY6485390.1 DUF1659 domain-containing protein [Clostridium aestuarii]
MATSANIKSTLNLKYVAGTDDKGKEIIKNQRLNKVKPDASDDNIYAVGGALSGLLPDDAVLEILREDAHLLTA